MSNLEHLTVVVDLSPEDWRQRRQQQQQQQQQQITPLVETVDALLVFFNAHLLLTRGNQLRVLAFRDGETSVLYPPPATSADPSVVLSSSTGGSASGGGGGESSAAGIDDADSMRGVLQRRFQTLIDQPHMPELPGARAGGGVARALSQTLCFVNQARQAQPHLPARVLFVQISPDVDAEYNAVMNGVFASQKMGVVLDSVAVGNTASPLLQQASHLTHGVHVHAHREPLLPALLSVFLSSQAHRAMLRTPETASVDLRAACFCHRKAVDVAFVCSVCLGIFCERTSECPTCHTRIVSAPPVNAAAAADAGEAAVAGSRKRPLE